LPLTPLEDLQAKLKDKTSKEEKGKTRKMKKVVGGRKNGERRPAKLSRK